MIGMVMGQEYRIHISYRQADRSEIAHSCAPYIDDENPVSGNYRRTGTRATGIGDRGASATHRNMKAVGKCCDIVAVHGRCNALRKKPLTDLGLEIPAQRKASARKGHQSDQYPAHMDILPVDE